MLAEMTTAVPREYKEFDKLFTEKEGIAALPEHKPWDHEIKLETGKKLGYKGWLKQLSKKEEDFLKGYIDKHLKKGFIRPSKSSISHGVLFAPKKDGDLRVCIDYRPLNAVTKKNRYPLPRIDELQDRLLGAKHFTSLDVRDAYYRVRMKEGHEEYTAFKTRFGLYEYTVMPFGLTNAPGTFQELINDTIRDYLDDFATAYLDDILIFSKTYEEHVQHVKKVLKALQEKDLPVKLSKCEFHKQRIHYLGYIISTDGIEVDPDKIKPIEDWPEPTNVTEVQAFVGLLNYYRKFIEGFSRVAGPLTELTKKDVRFYFGPKAKEAFLRLKKAITIAPILAIFDPERESTVETDASDGAIGARLTQKDADGKVRTIAYFSRKMTGPELNYDIHDKELLAIVESLKQWRVYLEGAKYPVQIYTDHKNLLYWTTTKELNRRQVRWSETLAQYDFKIHHVRGKENGVADALSRRPDYMKDLKPQPMALLKHQNGTMSYAQPDIKELNHMDIELSDQQKQDVIRSRHDDKSAGHPGIEKTLELVTRDFTWKGIRKDVKEYIQQCDTCKKTKHERHRPYGLLQEPEIPDKAWSTIALDFIVKLPKSKEPLTGVEFDTILVINDILTKYAYFIPYKEASTAEELAYTLYKNIIAQHGTPEIIKSDRDKLFTSQFWQSLMDLSGTHHKLSTAYHPETDGQTERTNQTLEQYLRAYVNFQQNNWVELLPIAQFAFNNSSTVTGISPFYANYGRHPEFDKDPRGKRPVAERAQVSIDKIQQLQKMLQSELQKITTKNTTNANKKRSEGPDFKKGEKVYILRKNIKTLRPSNKLDQTKIGPYEIKEKLGPVTFELILPEGINIHPVFHKSLLEKAPQDATPGPVLIHKETQQPMYDVEEILDCKVINGQPKFLIKWLGYGDAENTWEPPEHLTKDIIRRYQQQNPEAQKDPRKSLPRTRGRPSKKDRRP